MCRGFGTSWSYSLFLYGGEGRVKSLYRPVDICYVLSNRTSACGYLCNDNKFIPFISPFGGVLLGPGIQHKVKVGMCLQRRFK